jgi:hypothetical protein
MKVALRQALQARRMSLPDPAAGRAEALLQIRHELGELLERSPLGPTPVGETAYRALLAAALDAAAREIAEEAPEA